MNIPTPTIERIPKTIDGCTWYAYVTKDDGTVIGATSRTKRDLLSEFAEQWGRFANTTESLVRVAYI